MTQLTRLIGILSLIAASSSTAAVLYSGVQNIPIPTTFAGVSLTLDRSDAAVFSQDTTATNTDGSSWDLNFFLGGAGLANSPSAQPVRDNAGDNLSFVHNLVPGTSVDSGSTFSSGFGGSGFPNQHIGSGTEAANTAANQFTSATTAFFGFVLDPGTAAPLYGWAKVILNNDGNPGVIESWAFESTPNTPILVNLVPEPSGVLLIAAGFAGLVLRRRR